MVIGGLEYRYGYLSKMFGGYFASSKPSDPVSIQGRGLWGVGFKV